MYRQETFGNNSVNSNTFLLAAVGLLALLVAGWVYLQATNGVKVTNGTHSTTKHLADARKIHDCLEEPGNVHEVWRFTSHRRNREFFQVCELDDGRFGLRLIQRVGKGLESFWKERTSFVVKNGTYHELNEYLTARAVRFVGKLSQVP